MTPLLDLLGAANHLPEIYKSSISGISLLNFLTWEGILFLSSLGFVSRIFNKEIDSFVLSALSLISGKSFQVFCLNLLVNQIGLFNAGVLSYAIPILLFLILAGPPSQTYRRLLSLPHPSFKEWAITLFIVFWSWALLLLSTPIDFEKVYFTLDQSIAFSGHTPQHPDGDLQFPYHYGGNLYDAGLNSLFGMKSWLAVKILPLMFCWTPFVLYRWMASHWFSKNGTCQMIALLSFFGSNIRFFFIFLLGMVHLFSGAGLYNSDSLESLKLATRDFDLNPSTVLTHIEHLLHHPSSLGYPAFLAVLAILVHSKSFSHKTSLVLLTFFSISSLHLFREDLFVWAIMAAVIYLFKYRLMVPRWLTATLILVLLLNTLYMGGLLSKEWISFQDSLFPTEPAASGVASTKAASPHRLVISFFLSWIPTLGSLSISTAKVAVPLWHPQIILDLILDYGPLLIFLFFTPWFFLRHAKDSWSILAPILFIGIAFCLFCKMPGRGYQLDLQRVMPYGFVVFFLACTAFKLIPNLLKKAVPFLLVSGILAGCALPGRFKFYEDWYHPDYPRIAQFIEAEGHSCHREHAISGLHYGFIGMPSLLPRNRNRLLNFKTSIRSDYKYADGKFLLIDKDERQLHWYIVLPKDSIPPEGSELLFTGEDFSLFR